MDTDKSAGGTAKSLLETLAELEDLPRGDRLPDVDETLPPLDDPFAVDAAPRLDAEAVGRLTDRGFAHKPASGH